MLLAGADPTLLAELEAKGYLSLNKFAKLIRISYPTAMRMLKDGRVMTIPVGGIHRVQRDECLRFFVKGNLASHSGPLSPEEMEKLLVELNETLASKRTLGRRIEGEPATPSADDWDGDI